MSCIIYQVVRVCGLLLISFCPCVKDKDIDYYFQGLSSDPECMKKTSENEELQINLLLYLKVDHEITPYSISNTHLALHLCKVGVS